MVLQADTVLGPNQLPVWQVDPGTGNTTQSGSMLALDLVLPPEASPVPPAPGFLKLYSPDGQSVTLITPAGSTAPVSNGPGFAAVSSPGATVTGVTAKTLLATGITVPAGALAAGQAYRITAWGVLSTTVDTQTVTFELDYGATALLNFGAQNPNSSATVTNSPWRVEFEVYVISATSVSVSGWDILNFFFASGNGATVTVASSTAKAFTLQVTPSATAVSVTCSGFTCERVV